MQTPPQRERVCLKTVHSALLSHTVCLFPPPATSWGRSSFTRLGVCGRQQQLTEVRVLDVLDPAQVQEPQSREAGGAERRHRTPRAACQDELLEAWAGKEETRVE